MDNINLKKQATCWLVANLPNQKRKHKSHSSMNRDWKFKKKSFLGFFSGREFPWSTHHPKHRDLHQADVQSVPHKLPLRWLILGRPEDVKEKVKAGVAMGGHQPPLCLSHCVSSFSHLLLAFLLPLFLSPSTLPAPLPSCRSCWHGSPDNLLFNS